MHQFIYNNIEFFLTQLKEIKEIKLKLDSKLNVQIFSLIKRGV